MAAIFIEPIQGEGGYVPAPDAFLQRLSELTHLHGIQLVVDEVQCGMGRTGKMFAFEWAGIEPDVICLAKGVASGMPLGLTIYRSDERDWGPGAHASTFGGNPLSCAAALTTLDLLDGGLMQNAARMGDRLCDRLRKVQGSSRLIGDVRGRGLMVGAEIVEGGRMAPHLRAAIVAECYQRGLILLGCGESTLRFAPALVITADEIDEGLDVFEASLAEVESHHAA